MAKLNLQDNQGKSIVVSARRKSHSDKVVEKSIGMVLGVLTVDRDGGYISSGISRRVVICKCVCGEEVTVRLGEWRPRPFCRHSRLGLGDFWNMQEFKIWKGIITRCTKEDGDSSHNYCHRGITVCPRWMSSFENFYEDMGPRPSPKHTVERVDNSLGYEKGNCVWATRKRQTNNTRRNILVEIEGRIMTLSMACDKYSDLSYDLVWWRINNGWGTMDALTIPPTNKNPSIRPSFRPNTGFLRGVSASRELIEELP